MMEYLDQRQILVHFEVVRNVEIGLRCRQISEYGPVGGEAVLCQKEYKKESGQIDPYEEKLPDKEIKKRKDMEILRKMQLTYLNSTHDRSFWISGKAR